MKLFAKYNRINLTAMAVLFVLSAFTYYSIINWVLIHELDESLDQYRIKIAEFVSKKHELPTIESVDDLQVQYKAVTVPTNKNYELVVLYNTSEQKNEKFRRLLYSQQVGGQYYEVSIAKPLEGVHLMAKLIAGTTLILFLVTIVISLLVNHLLLRRLWTPFFRIIDSIRKYKLDSREPVYPDTDIDEFIMMRNALKEMIANTERDYRTLKEFTENASHELQTPLAIIRSKLDLVIQEEGLSEKQVSALQSAYANIKRLTTMNQSLLLLAKIENRQYSTNESIDVAKKVNEKLDDFKEFWQDKNIKLTANLDDSSIVANSDMIDLLLANLLSNAGRHTPAGGTIDIGSGPGELQIRNTAQDKALDKLRLFTRFYKEKTSNTYNGLGLSIVKHICDQAGITIEYNFERNEHIFSLRW
ncbi:MAG: Signal transduction histidine kinase [Flavipsychrobacter sp.]|nr:Signal transduction histidine kinase [Flavipsychrobacter sp.]